MNIKTVYENKRGCGFRKPGGIYLRTDGLSKECGLFPVPLETCLHCGGGIKPSRGFTWIDADLVTSGICKMGISIKQDDVKYCRECLMHSITGRCGLLWIGEKYYPSPQKFLDECKTMGVSRRIKMVPNGFKIGITPIFVAHRKAILRNGDFIPGIFQMFIPDRIEYVVMGTETEDELNNLIKRGFDLVDVKPINQNSKLELE